MVAQLALECTLHVYITSHGGGLMEGQIKGTSLKVKGTTMGERGHGYA